MGFVISLVLSPLPEFPQKASVWVPLTPGEGLRESLGSTLVFSPKDLASGG